MEIYINCDDDNVSLSDNHIANNITPLLDSLLNNSEVNIDDLKVLFEKYETYDFTNRFIGYTSSFALITALSNLSDLCNEKDIKLQNKIYLEFNNNVALFTNKEFVNLIQEHYNKHYDTLYNWFKLNNLL